MYLLAERDPESIDVANDERTHAVKSVVESLYDVNSVLEAEEEVTTLSVCMYRSTSRLWLCSVFLLR
jgi:hypothetical protein